eukprot:GHVN01014538.1.p2 GENE.GHVN01014538.1~~GHVN01014538.1.p2  ORF type:complete len:113 (+),score=18.10 GHVN01014538.1:812-1150(+)
MPWRPPTVFGPGDFFFRVVKENVRFNHRFSGWPLLLFPIAFNYGLGYFVNTWWQKSRTMVLWLGESSILSHPTLNAHAPENVWAPREVPLMSKYGGGTEESEGEEGEGEEEE